MGRLIIYPHGLGDIILLTPALRALAGKGYHVAMLKRFAGTEILDYCPYIEPGCCHYVLPDPWNNPGGRNATKAAGCKLARELKMTPTWVWHLPGKHKIHENFRQLGTVSQNLQTEFWWTRQHMAQATDFLSLHRYWIGFLHCSTGMPGLSTAAPKKDFPSEVGRAWLLRCGCAGVVEVGVEMEMSLPMPTQFLIMKAAHMVCLADSVFYHACHAMNKDVDFAYFGRGKGVWERVRPLHDHMEVVSWEYPSIQSSPADPGRV